VFRDLERWPRVDIGGREILSVREGLERWRGVSDNAEGAGPVF
jgi:hypothetical protein